jgi:endogenous inhibitor of DNA gyrase (YacG/DUF329 family)
MMSESPSGGKTTTCDKCGEPSVIYPPTPDYTELLLQPCEKGDSMERPFECRNCGEINKRHWDKGHAIITGTKYKVIPESPTEGLYSPSKARRNTEDYFSR